jgi:hypothetical protein
VKLTDERVCVVAACFIGEYSSKLRGTTDENKIIIELLFGVMYLSGIDSVDTS